MTVEDFADLLVGCYSDSRLVVEIGDKVVDIEGIEFDDRENIAYIKLEKK